MNNKILLIDNETRYIDKLSECLNDDLKVKVDKITDLGNIDSFSFDYDIYFIRLTKQTSNIIKNLCKMEKTVVILATRDLDDIIKEIHSLSPSDYIITSENKNISIAYNIAKRLLLNKHMRALVVDDSELGLKNLTLILKRQGLECITCADGQEAWEYLNNSESKNIDIVLADYEMPNVDGYELTKLIRSKYTFEELPILILSATLKTNVISRFLRVGANDYIPKPFIEEELIARLSNSLTTLNMFRDIKAMALNDHLTGLHNRAYLFEVGNKTVDIMKRNKSDFSIGMCDIDNFKNINDTYGHNFGDEALKLVAEALNDSIRASDICARFGGEEFIFILPNCPKEKSILISENIRKAVENIELIKGTKSISLTISIGVTSSIDSLDSMISRADELMYDAKRSGKNKVCHD